MPNMPDPPIAGFERQWVRCKDCGTIAYYDFQPYSLSHPIKTLPCGHGAAVTWDEAVDCISEQDALDALGINDPRDPVWDEIAHAYGAHNAPTPA